MALLGRFAYNLTEQDWLFVLVFVDDLHLAAGGQNRWLAIWKFLVALEMSPFLIRNLEAVFRWIMLVIGWAVLVLSWGFQRRELTYQVCGGPTG